MVIDILSVCSLDAHMLFDPRSTHSYVSHVFAKRFPNKLVRLEKPFLMGANLVITVWLSQLLCVCVQEGYYNGPYASRDARLGCDFGHKLAFLMPYNG